MHPGLEKPGPMPSHLSTGEGGATTRHKTARSLGKNPNTSLRESGELRPGKSDVSLEMASDRLVSLDRQKRARGPQRRGVDAGSRGGRLALASLPRLPVAATTPRPARPRRPSYLLSDTAPEARRRCSRRTAHNDRTAMFQTGAPTLRTRI